MSASPIMSAAESRNLLSLATTAPNLDASASAGAALLLQAKQLNAVRAQLRDGETFSVTA